MNYLIDSYGEYIKVNNKYCNPVSPNQMLDSTIISVENLIENITFLYRIIETNFINEKRCSVLYLIVLVCFKTLIRFYHQRI